MKKIHLSLILFLLTACSYIGEEERLIYVKPEPAKRVVLLEDFTGQKCVNCPKGTEVIEQLQETYGDTAVIAVGIHGGPLGFAGNAKYQGLATQAGDDYFTHWGFEYQPVGLVNRHGEVKYTDWATAVREELSKPAPLQLGVDASLDDGHIYIMVGAYGTDGQVTGKLQVWLVEDSITAMQMMPDAKVNTEYVHNHVLRAVVNGLWGDDFAVNEGEWKECQLTFQPDTAWNPEHLSIVAFVYNNEGVLQATRNSLTPSPSPKGEGSNVGEGD